MIPAIDKTTGNFETVQYLLLSKAGEILVEIRDDGSIAIPGDYVLTGDLSTNTQADRIVKERAIDRLLLSNLGVRCLDKEFLCTLEFKEEEKHFNCSYFICRNWVGEIQKRTKQNTRLMWVAKGFAVNLLTESVDKTAVRRMG